MNAATPRRPDLGVGPGSHRALCFVRGPPPPPAGACAAHVGTAPAHVCSKSACELLSIPGVTRAACVTPPRPTPPHPPLPALRAGPIAIIRNWTYCLFYVMAELWGSVVVSVLFWGFANQVRAAHTERLIHKRVLSSASFRACSNLVCRWTRGRGQAYHCYLNTYWGGARGTAPRPPAPPPRAARGGAGFLQKLTPLRVPNFPLP